MWKIVKMTEVEPGSDWKTTIRTVDGSFSQ